MTQTDKTEGARAQIYDGWKATSPAHAIVRMLEFHGDRPSERIVEIDRIIKSALTPEPAVDVLKECVDSIAIQPMTFEMEDAWDGDVEEKYDEIIEAAREAVKQYRNLIPTSRADRLKSLDELTLLSQELGLYDEPTAKPVRGDALTGAPTEKQFDGLEDIRHTVIDMSYPASSQAPAPDLGKIVKTLEYARRCTNNVISQAPMGSVAFEQAASARDYIDAAIEAVKQAGKR